MEIPESLKSARQHHLAGRLDQADAIYRQILAQQPDHPDALHLLGVLAGQQGNPGWAIRLIERAISLHPQRYDYLCSLGRVLIDQKNYPRAVEIFVDATSLRPELFIGWAELGRALYLNNERRDAIIAYRQAREIDPNQPELHLNLAIALEVEGDLSEAKASYARAIALDPNCTKAHHNYAPLLIKTGELLPGWRELELENESLDRAASRHVDHPHWDGNPAPGKRMLLYVCRGQGDAIHLIRYLPMLKKVHADFFAECHAPLVDLFQASYPQTRFYARGEQLPDFDIRLRVESLPHVLRIASADLPCSIPYLRAPGDRNKRWAGRIPQDGQLNIGLVWAGSESEHRSKTIEVFSPLLKIPGVRFVSLQKGPESSQRPPAGTNLLDFTAEIADFADSASLLGQLDLLISVDTSTAHLAGAIGKPVWVLIPSRSDFRWFLDRTDTPWYPTMRLFRQKIAGEWNPPVQEMVVNLQALLAAKHHSTKIP
jgi:Flp pilus assembly protein TadD